MEMLTYLENLFATANPLLIATVVSATLILWFLPAVLAFVFNRKSVKLITAACVPAGFSLVAWCGLLIWAVTGKSVDDLKRTRKQAVTES